MSEIEKMYENANVKKYWNLTYTPYGSVEEHYPPFTAEKQLELVKWLSENDVVRIEKYTLNGETFFELACTFNDWYDDYKYSYATEKFEEALAGLINDRWQDLTEEERKQIRRVLEK